MAMASTSSFLLLCLALLLLFFTNSQASSMETSSSKFHQQGADPLLYGGSKGSLRPQECGGRCAVRCSATAHKKPCMLYCKKCCATCLCVPPGTYGNKQVCPCYNNWKTQSGGPKCP